MEKERCEVCKNMFLAPRRFSRVKCELCDRELCEECVGHEFSITNDDGRQCARTVFCKECWDAGIYYRAEIDKYSKIIDSLDEEWRKKCKNHV